MSSQSDTKQQVVTQICAKFQEDGVQPHEVIVKDNGEIWIDRTARGRRNVPFKVGRWDVRWLDLLAQVNPHRALLDSQELSAIDAARKDGCTWLEIGRALGYTGSEKTISTSGRQRAGRLRLTVSTGGRRLRWSDEGEGS